MNAHHISVIIATYKGEKPAYLDRALRSIWDDQKRKPDEIVLVEDGPLTTGLCSVVDAWKEILESRLVVIEKPVNQGLAAALNDAIEVAHGDLIARMDSDDISLPDRFMLQEQYMDHTRVQRRRHTLGRPALPRHDAGGAANDVQGIASGPSHSDVSLIILQGRLQIQQQISYLRGCDDVVRCSCRRTGDKQSAGCLAGIPAQSISHATKKPREGMERVPCLQRRHKQALWQVQLQVHLFLHAHVFPPHARIAGIPHLRQQAQAHICPPRIEGFSCKNSLQN